MSKTDAVWEYVVLLHPTEKEAKAGERAEVLGHSTTCIAKDENEAKVIAIQGLDPSESHPTDRLEVLVRPFCP